VSLAYDSQSNTTLAGSGWDLYVGWPMTIMRDVRFGTPQWVRASAWLWGATALVPANAPTCGVDSTSGMLVGDCSFRFRLAPEALALVTIELKSGLESAHVNLADGTVLLYEPVVYDGKSYPGAPAGAETPVLGFRLAAAVDRNGFRTCFRYRAPVVPAATPASDLPDPDGHWGEPAILEDIYFGAPPAGGDCASQASHPVHRVHFQYEAMSPTFSHAWSMKFGAPVSFDSLLTGVSVYANGATTAQDSFALAYVGGDSETRRPLLASISGTTPSQSGSTSTDTRVFRTFDYGQRMLQFDTGQVVELGALGKFPQSLAGAVSRPMRRANSSQGLFGQVGRDQVTDAAPWTHATTEEWQFSDINGDGLPDIQWGDESGSSTKWSTFEGSTDPTAVQPPQQQVLINEGVVGSHLVTTALELNSHANSTNAMSLESLYVSAANTGAPGFTPWFWGRGGETPGPPCRSRSRRQRSPKWSRAAQTCRWARTHASGRSIRMALLVARKDRWGIRSPPQILSRPEETATWAIRSLRWR
jgi:hypothetical protein